MSLGNREDGAKRWSEAERPVCPRCKKVPRGIGQTHKRPAGEHLRRVSLAVPFCTKGAASVYF